MMKFLSKNGNKYSLYLKKWEKVGSKKHQYSSTTYDCFDWVTHETKLIENQKSDVPELLIDNKAVTINGYSLCCSDISQRSWGGAIISDVKLQVSVYGWLASTKLDMMEKFINKIPKQSRKKLIKLIFLYELSDEKNYHTFERLYHRLSSRFGFELSHNPSKFKFTGISPTYPLNKNRNRRINNIFRYGRKIFRG